MSKIVEFREKVIEAIGTLFPELDIEWYDGQFDEQDIADWTVKTPCARVAVMNVPTENHTTGELNACLRVVVVIIDENKYADRDGDARAWNYVESIATFANQNQFGHPDAAAATKVKFQRISQPVLRREGVSVGVVEWESGLMIGANRARERDMAMYLGLPVDKMPLRRVTAHDHMHTAALAADEDADVTPEEE